MKWKIFKDFLVKKKALNAYLCSYGNHSRIQRPFISYIEHLGKTEPDMSLWIDTSIVWARTKEGTEYWSRLNMELVDYCSKFTDGKGNIDVMLYNTTRLV